MVQLADQFLTATPGAGGTTAYAPVPFFQGGDIPQGVKKAGRRYAQEEADFVSQVQGQKGFLDSSFYEQGLAGSFERGMGLAQQQWLQQQSLFAQWANVQNQMNASIGAEKQSSGIFGGMAKGAIAGASIGGMTKTPTGIGIGAAIGAGAGLLDQLFGLDIF